VDQRDDRHLRVRRPASARALAALLTATAAAAAALAAGCQFPQDVGDTLNTVEDGGTLRVGVTEHEPWVSLQTEEPSGVEVGLVREFASRLRARVDYTQGSEEELVEALHRRELDVVIGGITDRTRWKKEVGMTKPYLTTHLVVGMPEGRELEDGERVVTERGTAAAALLEKKTGAIPVRRDSLEGLEGRPAVVHHWLLDDLRLRSAKALEHDEHVMLTAPGENAFLVRLEHFLLDRKQRALRLLDEEGRP
jgi:polar amino acid transport system substrate-binding protein